MNCSFVHKLYYVNFILIRRAAGYIVQVYLHRTEDLLLPPHFSPLTLRIFRRHSEGATLEEEDHKAEKYVYGKNTEKQYDKRLRRVVHCVLCNDKDRYIKRDVRMQFLRTILSKIQHRIVWILVLNAFKLAWDSMHISIRNSIACYNEILYK